MNSKAFPRSLKTRTKRIDKARKLVEDHLKVTAANGRLAGFQGMWSETYILTLKGDHQKAVIQFRAEPLDIAAFQRAEKLLGTYCLTVELLHDSELEDAGFYPVYMSFIRGHSWCTDFKQKTDPKFNVTVVESLGKVLARCVVDEENATPDGVIEKLDKRLASQRQELDPFRALIQDLKARA